MIYNPTSASWDAEIPRHAFEGDAGILHAHLTCALLMVFQAFAGAIDCIYPCGEDPGACWILDEISCTPFHAKFIAFQSGNAVSCAGGEITSWTLDEAASGPYYASCNPVLVLGCNDLPLPGATVVYKDSGGTTLDSGTTGSDGRYVPEFTGTLASITVSKDRFVTQVFADDNIPCCVYNPLEVKLLPAEGYHCLGGHGGDCTDPADTLACGCPDPLAGTLHATHPLFGARTFFYSAGALAGAGWYSCLFYDYPGCSGCPPKRVFCCGYLLAGDGTYHDTWKVVDNCPNQDEVGPNLVTNGSFETQDFSNWTLDFAPDDEAHYIGILNKFPCGIATEGTLNPACAFCNEFVANYPGGFPYNQPGQSYPPSSHRADPSGTQVFFQGTVYCPTDGTYAAYFFNGSEGSISQSVTTIPGATYQITYDAHAQLGESANYMEVTWDSTVLLEQAAFLDMPGWFRPSFFHSDVGTHGITAEIVRVVATSTSHTLKFTFFNPYDAYTLDNVRVVRIQTPVDVIADWTSPGPVCGESFTMEFDLTPTTDIDRDFYCTSSPMSFFFTE